MYILLQGIYLRKIRSRAVVESKYKVIEVEISSNIIRCAYDIVVTILHHFLSYC